MKSNHSEIPNSSPTEREAKQLLYRMSNHFGYAMTVDDISRALVEAEERGRRAGIEESAALCGRITDKYTLLDDRLQGLRADIVSEECARQIRALMEAK